MSDKVMSRATFTPARNHIDADGYLSGLGTLGQLLELVEKARLFADSAGIRQRDLQVRIVSTFSGKVKAINCEVWRDSDGK